MNNEATVIAAPADVLTEKPRISSIDVLRGIVMVIMALDHTRDFFHVGAFTYDATNMQTTNPALFFTRWITHYCAPTFVLLAGTSIYINLQRKTKKDLSIFLLTRGLWLVFLELVVVRFGLFFNFYYDVLFLQVIWAIGASMICLAALIHLPYKAVLTVGVVIVAGHNFADISPLTPENPLFPIWATLRQFGFFPISENTAVFVPYPLLPWLGIMLLGFGLGKLYQKQYDPLKRRRVLLQLGFATIVLFVILRLINVYGDPAPWSVQKNSVFTVMSFVNVTKYPVSLLYTLMTLGPVLIALALLEKVNYNFLKPFQVFGRVPMFYYILHFYLIHAVSLLLFMNKTGVSFSDIDFHFNKSFGGITNEGGYSLGWTYVAWISIVLFLYPLCKWYNNYKSTHKNWWLSYV
jgi:uncharacterized membrane protein